MFTIKICQCTTGSTRLKFSVSVLMIENNCMKCAEALVLKDDRLKGILSDFRRVRGVATKGWCSTCNGSISVHEQC